MFSYAMLSKVYTPHTLSPPASIRRAIAVTLRKGSAGSAHTAVLAQNPSRCFSRSSHPFIDRITIVVKAGNGGPGCASFARGPQKEMAPPDGGHGGLGGSVWLEANTDCTSLRMASKAIKAENGGPGMSAKQRGKDGNDLVVPVPPGTIVRELPLLIEDEFFEPSPIFSEPILIAELNTPGESAKVALGGMGGRGNTAFKSSRNRSPQNFEPGQSGEHRKLEMELKIIADVGLVGFPNAGKSTFLRAISRAKPKVASYPFTTLRPHIGVVQAATNDDKLKDRTLTVADIPGLIEGAHENRGLGHAFLRHIERTKFLVYVLDLSVPTGRVLNDLEILRNELEKHEEGLSTRPCCIAANKMDIGVSSFENLNILLKSVGVKIPIFPLSAKHKTGTDGIVEHLSACVL